MRSPFSYPHCIWRRHMKCLMKYRWVKLLRALVLTGKGVILWPYQRCDARNVGWRRRGWDSAAGRKRSERLQCSGAECMDGAVYATDGYGFLYIPRSITERLVRASYTFSAISGLCDGDEVHPQRAQQDHPSSAQYQTGARQTRRSDGLSVF